MDIRNTLASQAYTRAREAAAPDAAEGGIAADFARMARNFTATLNEAEATSRAAMTGQADPQALVEALTSSTSAVETAVTIRDRVVEAYQEILRMPV